MHKLFFLYSMCLYYLSIVHIKTAKWVISPLISSAVFINVCTSTSVFPTEWVGEIIFLY